jgi:lipopolysaccharide/colanic/teichoic acid biosynthesis glycosyltransferase
MRQAVVPMFGETSPSMGDFLKRGLDVVAGAALVGGLGPLMAVIALALVASGAKSVLFRQVRVGAGGREFTLLKFRTMACGDEAPFAQAVPGDPRVTRIGRWLRKTSLDELPQLFNVLSGEMSLVGPRPHAPETKVAGKSLEEAAKFYRLRYLVKPGMTGLAQVRGLRGATGDVRALRRRVASDLEYIERWSIWLDLLILIRTLPAVLRPRNAY